MIPFTAQIVVAILILIVTFYVVVYVIYEKKGTNDMLPKMTPLNKKTKVVDPDEARDKLIGSAGSTVLGFFKLQNGDRTAKYANQYTSLMEIPENWYLEIAPSPIENKPTSARLRIRVKDNQAIKTEVIDLPSIPRQKWVMIAVLRDGRRFDVMYDNKTVMSHRLKNYPVIISNPLNVGNAGLDGSAIHVVINNRRMNPLEVERERTSYVDTNNVVFEDNTLYMSFPLPTIKLFGQCPPGFPCDPVTKPPKNNLLAWESPY
jgi:hypothetical protein